MDLKPCTRCDEQEKEKLLMLNGYGNEFRVFKSDTLQELGYEEGDIVCRKCYYELVNKHNLPITLKARMSVYNPRNFSK